MAYRAELRDVCAFFFLQAEDGIRDLTVTGVQTCALPISLDLRGDEAEVRSLDGSEDVDHRRSVVVAHHGRGDAAVKAGKVGEQLRGPAAVAGDRKSTRLNSSHSQISYAVFCL